jgi:transposase InsO family protein
MDVVLRHLLGEPVDDLFKFRGIAPSFAFAAAPQTNGIAERFNRTLKKQVFRGRIFQNLEAVRAAVSEFKERCNLHWHPEKMGFVSSIEVR